MKVLLVEVEVIVTAAVVGGETMTGAENRKRNKYILILYTLKNYSSGFDFIFKLTFYISKFSILVTALNRTDNWLILRRHHPVEVMILSTHCPIQLLTFDHSQVHDHLLVVEYAIDIHPAAIRSAVCSPHT